MNDNERCDGCDGWGWVTDPENVYGPEKPCPECDGSGRCSE